MPNGMRRDDLPPPVRGGLDRGGPRMAESPKSSELLMRLAGGPGGPGGQGGQPPQAQAAQLVMSAAEQLMSAAQIDPSIAPIVQEAVQLLSSRLSSIGGPPGAGGPPMGGAPRRRRSRQPRPMEGEGEGEVGSEGAIPPM